MSVEQLRLPLFEQPLRLGQRCFSVGCSARRCPLHFDYLGAALDRDTTNCTRGEVMPVPHSILDRGEKVFGFRLVPTMLCSARFQRPPDAGAVWLLPRVITLMQHRILGETIRIQRRRGRWFIIRMHCAVTC